LATLVNLDDYQKTTKAEGSLYEGVTLTRVEEESILLTHPGEGELRKPRIDMELEFLVSEDIGSGSAEALLARHQQIWGNRIAGGNQETPFARQPATPEEIRRQREARRRYIEKMEIFQRRIEAEDPTLDPHDSPLLPTAEDAIRQGREKAQDNRLQDEGGNVESEAEGAGIP
jgi:hypothetical protein